MRFPGYILPFFFSRLTPQFHSPLLKKDTTGPSDATKGIIVIYDIFGYFPQTLQGADILGTSDDAQKYRVFIPDWFGGKPFPIEKFPPDTPEKQKDLGEFFNAYSPPSVAAKIPAYLDAVSAKYPGIKTWALLGVSFVFPCLAIGGPELQGVENR